MSDFAKVEQSLREEMTRIASSFFQRGYATGSAGNLSLLLPDGIYWRHRQVHAQAISIRSGFPKSPRMANG